MARTAKKAEFVMRHFNKQPREIIEAGAAAGISLSKSYVQKVLAERPRPRGTSKHTETAAEFSKLVWRIGTVRVREWLAELDKAPIAG